MARKNFNARPPATEHQVPGRRPPSTTLAVALARVEQTEERPPVDAGGPSAQPTCECTRGAFHGNGSGSRG